MTFAKVKEFFCETQNGKATVDKKRIFLTVAILVFSVAIIVNLFSGGKDQSSLKITSQKIQDSSEKEKSEELSPEDSEKLASLLARRNSSNPTRKGRNTRNGGRAKDIQYKAVQVLIRKSPDSLLDGMPIGSNLIGKLLTSIDTRETGQLYKVLLPYGGKSKNGYELPKNTVIFGKAKYSGKGDKVFLQFSKALLPNGKEKNFVAQALNSKDYSPGITGDFHGKSVERVSATLALTMVSAMGDTLTEKEALGKGETLSIKSSPRNAFYQGVAKVSELEANRHASELSGAQEYVTVPAGTDLIVNLQKSFGG